MAIPRKEGLPSATAIRAELTGSGVHRMEYGERAMLAVLRTLPDSAFETMPFGSEGLWSKVRRACRREDSLEELGERGVDPADPSPGTEEEALRRDEHARLRSAIAGLPEDQRDALVLTQLEGKSYEEAARLLETTEGTVKSRVARARDKLKRIFAEEGELSPGGSVQRSEHIKRGKGGKDCG